MAEGHRMCYEAVIAAKGWLLLKKNKKHRREQNKKSHGWLLMNFTCWRLLLFRKARKMAHICMAQWKKTMKTLSKVTHVCIEFFHGCMVRFFFFFFLSFLKYIICLPKPFKPCICKADFQNSQVALVPSKCWGTMGSWDGNIIQRKSMFIYMI